MIFIDLHCLVGNKEASTYTKLETDQRLKDALQVNGEVNNLLVLMQSQSVLESKRQSSCLHAS